MQKKKNLMQFLIFFCYELSVCPLILKSNKVYFAASLIANCVCSRSQVMLPMLYALGTGCVPLHIDSFCNFLFDSNIKTCQIAMNMFLFNIFDLKKLVFKKNIYIILFNQIADYFHVTSFSVIIVTSMLFILKVSKSQKVFFLKL